MSDEMMPAYASYVSGSVAGLVGGLVGHPADTLKLRMQTLGLSLSEASVQAMAQPLSLFRGIGAGLATQFAVGSLLFGTYDNIKKKLAFKGDTFSDRLLKGLAAGSIAGLLLSPATSLLEMRKCQYQHGAMPMLSFATLGLTATAARCGAGNAAYFGVYESLKTFDVLFAGALAGVAYWTLAMPFDIVKSRQHCTGKTFIDTFRGIPLSQLWRGWTPAVLRALPMNALCFFAYQTTNDILANFLGKATILTANNNKGVSVGEKTGQQTTTTGEVTLFDEEHRPRNNKTYSDALLGDRRSMSSNHS